jgi:mono/diheme cytochrome c family protein
MRKSTRVASFTLVAALLVACVVLTSTLRQGFSTHDQPTKMETMLATSMRHWSVPAALRNARNPVPLTPEILAETRAHFADHCAICHGNDGKGQTYMGQRFYPKAPDMTLPDTQKLSDGELFSIIENGVRMTAMPGWGDGTAQSGRVSWILVHFIRHLPQITAAELGEMKGMNPVNPRQLAQQKEEERQEESFLGGQTTAAPEPMHDHR